MVRKTSISLTARNENGELIGITDFAYRLFITDLGIVRKFTGKGIGKALVKRLHEIADGEKDIVMYTCVSEKAVLFSRKSV